MAVRRCRILLALFLLLLVASCEAVNEQTNGEDSLRASEGGEEVVSFDRASQFQAELLADGKITFTEYETAFFAAVECTRRRGVAIDQPTLAEDGVQYVASFQNDVIDGVTSLEIWEQCRREFSELVEVKYIDSIAPSFEQKLAELEQIAICLEELGIDVSDQRNPSDLVRAARERPDSKSICFPPGFFGDE